MRIRSEHSLLFLLVLVAVLPSLAWIALDRSAWPWDQAFYAKYTVDLFFALVRSPSAWSTAMVTGLGRMAPGIGWFGQFFVPVGALAGSIDFGLLLSLVVAQAFALALVSVAMWELSRNEFRVAVIGLIVMASAPAFVALGHVYVVEMHQTAAVAWFVFIMACAPRWPRLMTLSQLWLATSFAMLAKVSSPAYCVGPGVVALYYCFREERSDWSDFRLRIAATLAIGLPLGAATVVWYFRNIQFVAAHVAMASSGNVAELYGKQEKFLPGLKYWLGAVRANFFPSPAVVVMAGVLLTFIVVSIARPRVQDRRFLLAACVALFEIVAVLSGFALNANRDNRYLLPLLPYFALLVCWLMHRLDVPVITLAVVAVFGFQWGSANAQALGLVARSLDTAPWLHAYDSDARSKTILETLVLKTCADPPGFHSNGVGVQLIWLNAPGVAYAAARESGPRHPVNCEYDAIGYFDDDQDRAWRELMAKKIAYYIAVDPTVHKIPATAVDTTVNQLNGPILSRIESSGLFQLEEPIPGLEGILIYRRVDLVDHIANGRALFVQGKIEQACNELEKATQLEPGNAEAWANLAQVYERMGRFDQTVAAGGRARAINPNHYYVNLFLARAHAQLKQWPDSAVRAEDAARNAPGISERATAFGIAGRSRIKAGDRMSGCDLLRRAADLQSSRVLEDEFASSGCRK
jgi:tetratricopeptide (TPR) repeat protein